MPFTVQLNARLRPIQYLDLTASTGIEVAPTLASQLRLDVVAEAAFLDASDATTTTVTASLVRLDPELPAYVVAGVPVDLSIAADAQGLIGIGPRGATTSSVRLITDETGEVSTTISSTAPGVVGDGFVLARAWIDEGLFVAVVRVPVVP